MSLKRSLPLTNAAVIAIAFLMYALLVSPEPVMKLARSASAPVYRLQDDGRVSLVCLIEWDSGAVGEIISAADASGTRLTFAMTGEWAVRNAEIVRCMTERGHGLALLIEENEADADDIRGRAETVRSVSGVAPPIAVCTAKNAERLKKSCAEAGLTPFVMTAKLGADPEGGEAIDSLLAFLHTGGWTLGFLPTGDSVKILPELIEKIKNMGYGIVPAHKMLYNYSDKI